MPQLVRTLARNCFLTWLWEPVLTLKHPEILGHRPDWHLHIGRESQNGDVNELLIGRWASLGCRVRELPLPVGVDSCTLGAMGDL